ncbi:hypothetical protein N7454_000168 [Penicillium verhagenii]|nr:hypothetical protein N7454_000168 [Penicillium verhagenii]
MPASASRAKSKKCQKACVRCRSMKVKCSGSEPCTRCARKKLRCHFPEEDVRISVSERYLRQLEEQIASTGSSIRRSEAAASPSGGTRHGVDLSTPNQTLLLEDHPWANISYGGF